jgi:hypothetical protein
VSEPANEFSPSGQPDAPAEQSPPAWWERYVWPRWLPTRARLPLLAQICGVAALLAAVAMPTVAEPEEIAPAMQVMAAADGAAGAQEPPPAPAEPARPAHLNLDVRHAFKSVNLTVTIDDKQELDTKIEGSGKKFGVLGRREERAYTRTFDLEPGVRVVRLRVHSPSEKFDQTRIERFELGSASVASLRVVVEKSGLAVFADRPAVVQAAPMRAPRPRTAEVMPMTAMTAARTAPTQPRGVLVELYLTLRSVLIAVAGFIATTSAAYVIEVFLNSRKRMLGL